jgi:hypothetical protein
MRTRCFPALGGARRNYARSGSKTHRRLQHDDLTTLRMLRRGDIKGRQACAGAPWVIRAEDLAGFAKGKRRKPPLTQNATQRVLDFQ